MLSAVQLHRTHGVAQARGRRAASADHLLMAAGMTVMFLPAATPVPPRAWAIVFSGHTAWVLWRVVRGSSRRSGTGSLFGDHRIVHVVASATMALSFAALPPDGLSGSAMSHAGVGPAGSVLATVSWVAAAFFLAHVLWCGVQLAAPSPPHRAAAAATHDRLPTLLVMSLGMSYMLVTMM